MSEELPFGIEYPKEYQHLKTAGYVALAVTLLVMIVSLTIIGGFTFFALQEAQTNTAFTKSIESRYIAEGGIEDMIYRVVSGKQYLASETLGVGNGTTTLTVSTSGTQKTIRSAGTRDNFQQNIETKVIVNATAVSFYYGIQVGDGGIDMTHLDGKIIGNVYSNGNVTGSGSVTGDVVVAGGITTTPSYSWEANDSDQAFATTTGSRDIAQSFIATSTAALNKVSVYIKKVGSPANDITLHITTDNSGKPNKTDIANAVIKNSSVGLSLSWIDVSFATPPNLTNGSKYWIVLDYDTNSSSNYWVWRKDSSNAYDTTNNTAKYTDNWSAQNAAWTLTNADLDFRVWIGGINTKIDGITIGDATSGTGRANVFVNATVHGSSCPNAYCIVENPARQEFAVSDGVIQDWKDDAVTSPGHVCGIADGCDASGNLNISGTKTLGPLKITGNLTFNNGATLVVNGTLWVQGTAEFANNCNVNLAAGYGGLSGVIISDGTMSVDNGCAFAGSGTAGSYILLVSAKNAPSSQVMDVGNNSSGVIYFAPHGRIYLKNNSAAKEVTAYGIDMAKATITYDQGLANLQFSSGPSGGYSVDGWQQVP